MRPFETEQVKAKLSCIIDEMQSNIISAVQESIRIESTEGTPKSGMPFGEGPANALQHALKLGESLGFKTRNLGNAVGYVEYGSGEEIIAVLGHLDVVPPGGGWIYPPFGGEIHDEILWGRGTLDDKGPIIGALFAMKAIEECGLEIQRRIRIIFGTNEETGSKDIPYYTKSEVAPVMGFTPDASYPVIFAEKGILTISISKKPKQINGKVKLLHLSGGTAPNIVPASAEAVVSYEAPLEQKLKGVGLAAHGSTPEQGKNAIIDLLKQLERLDFCSDLLQFFAFLSNHIGEETDGRSMGVEIQDEKFGNLTLNLAAIQLTAPSDSIGSSEQEITAVINIRYPITKNAEDILQVIFSKASDAGMDTAMLSHKAPLYVKEDSQLIQILQHSYAQSTGQKAELLAIGGGTYAKAMDNIVAFGPLFPGQEDVTHQANEHITIDNLMKNVKIMASAMYLLAQ